MPVGALSRHPVRDVPAQRRGDARPHGRPAARVGWPRRQRGRRTPRSGSHPRLALARPRRRPQHLGRRPVGGARRRRTSWSPTPGRTRSPRRPRPAGRRSCCRSADPTTSSTPPARCSPTAGRPSSGPPGPPPTSGPACSTGPPTSTRSAGRNGATAGPPTGSPTSVLETPRAPRRRGCPMSRVAVVTIAHGRHEHLAAQHGSLARGTVRPDHYLAVAMDDPAIVEATGRRAHPRGRRRRSRTRGRPAAGRRPQPRRPHRDRRRRRRGGAARRRLPGRGRARGVVRRRGHGATGAHLVGTGDLPASPPAGRLPRRPGRPRGLGRPAPGATEPCARRAAGVRRPRPLLVAVLRACTRARGSASAASARTTSATAARTPTWVVRRSPAASGSAGSAAPAPTTSTTR